MRRVLVVVLLVAAMLIATSIGAGASCGNCSMFNGSSSSYITPTNSPNWKVEFDATTRVVTLDDADELWVRVTGYRDGSIYLGSAERWNPNGGFVLTFSGYAFAVDQWVGEYEAFGWHKGTMDVCSYCGEYDIARTETSYKKKSITSGYYDGGICAATLNGGVDSGNSVSSYEDAMSEARQVFGISSSKWTNANPYELRRSLGDTQNIRAWADAYFEVFDTYLEVGDLKPEAYWNADGSTGLILIRKSNGKSIAVSLSQELVEKVIETPDGLKTIQVIEWHVHNTQMKQLGGGSHK